MIPGMMCDDRLFAPQVAALSGNYEITIPQQRDQDTISGFADDILAKAPEMFALLGLSMGGIIAMEILRQAPKRVTKIALLDTNPLAESNAIKQKRGPQIEAVKNGQLIKVMREQMIPNYLADRVKHTAISDICLDMARALGPDVFIKQSKALMTRPDQTETLKNADIPALVLCGRADILCPLDRHQLMCEFLPNAKLEIIENAGHLPVLEQPDITTDKIRTWLA